MNDNHSESEDQTVVIMGNGKVIPVTDPTYEDKLNGVTLCCFGNPYRYKETYQSFLRRNTTHE